MSDVGGANRATLHRVLGRRDLVLLFVVAIANLNVVPVIAREGPATLWLWLLALAFFFWPQGIGVIEMSARNPAEGGIYAWSKDVFGDFHGFLSGWCYWTNNVFYVPTVLLYLVGLLEYGLGLDAGGLAESKLTAFLLTFVFLWVMVVLNVVGLGVGKWVNNLGGIGTACAAVLLIGLGAAVSAREGVGFAAADLWGGAGGWRTISAFGLICFGLVGLELGSVMGGEIRDPDKDVPGAVFWGGLLAGLLYLGATAAVLSAVPQHEIGVLQGLMQAVSRMAASVGVGWIVVPLALLLAISVAGIASAWLGGSARVPFVAGLDSYLPPALGRLHPRYATPWVALVTHGVLSTFFLAMSFGGATVAEAYSTLLALAVVLQLIPFLYLYAGLLRLTGAGTTKPLRFSRKLLRFAGMSGLATTTLGMVVAFVPSSQIESVLLFELKMLLGCFFFLGLGVFFHWRGSRRR